MNREGFQPDFTREAGEVETRHMFTGGQELTESEEVGPDGQHYKVSKQRNATGGFSETREEAGSSSLKPDSAGGGESIPPINIFQEMVSSQDDKKIPSDLIDDNQTDKDSNLK